MKHHLSFCLLHSASSLTVGMLCYLFLRRGTHLHRLFHWDFCLPLGDQADFFRYYLPDALWSYGLCFALGAFLPVRTALILTLTSSCLWELMQYFSLVGGTGDIWDVVSCAAAAMIAATILKTEDKK